MAKAYTMKNDINIAYSIHVEYCQRRGIAPKSLEQFKLLMRDPSSR